MVVGVAFQRGGGHSAREAGVVPLPDTPSAAEQALLDAVAAAPAGDPAPARRLGDFYADDGRPFAALWAYARALDASPGDVPTTLGVARALEAGLLYEAAIARLKSVLAREPSHPEAAARLAGLYLRTGRPEQALVVLVAAGSVSSARRASGPDALALLEGRARQAMGDATGAHAAYRRAAEAGGAEAPEAWWRLGRLALEEGKLPEARQALERAATLAPLEPRYAVDLARALAADGTAAGREAALARLREVARGVPYAPAFYEAGRLLRAQGRLPQAAAAFARATAADRNFADAYHELAELLDRTGRRAEAHYQRALYFSVRDLRVRSMREYLAMFEADPSRPDGLLLASQSRFKMQQNAQGVALARRARDRFPAHPEVREQLAALLILVNDRQAAAEICRDWLKAEPEAAAPLRMLGRIAVADLRFEEGIQYYERALGKEPENADFLIALGEALLSAPGAENRARAVEVLARAAVLSPADARARYHLGVALMQTGRPEEALRQLLRTLDLDPNRGPTYSTVVQLARRLRQPGPIALFGPIVREVEDRLREELALWRQTWDHPDDPGGYLTLARFLIRTAEPAKAEAQLEEALRLRPRWSEARAELLRVRRLLAVL